MNPLPKVYNPKSIENTIYSLWEKSGFFNPHKLGKKKGRKKPYTIIMAPPNITGSLHMGHALEYTISDILIRYKRLQGHKTLWLPGTDHAGIATQNVVEKELKKEGLTRHDIGREKLLKKIWAWKEKYGNAIIEQLKKLGCSADWSRIRFTMDEQYQKAVQEAFLHYFKKNWIYRAERIVNWCPRCKTSLSDLELEYKEEEGTLWYIRYPLKTTPEYAKLKYITVATTRPETMVGDTAIAVHPSDKRYKHIIGKKAILPLVNRELPVIADKAVDPDFGTGAVKITPAHDLADYEMGLRHHLPLIKVIDESGRMTQHVPPSYQGLSAQEARAKIAEDLRTAGFLQKTESCRHQIPKCYRCNTTIEFLPSWQWFLKMNRLAQMARKAVRERKVIFIPQRWEKLYFDWLNTIKDWCISRQIWWGHRLPVWFCKAKQTKKIFPPRLPSSQVNTEGKLEIENPSSPSVFYTISAFKPKQCPFCKTCEMEQSEDVLDTWFSSALWPFAVLGWPRKTKDLKEFYPATLNTNDRGIINLWDARMIFSGIEFMKKPPFKINLIHPTILTREGKRMSKSLGTGVDPIDLIEQYGADALRFGLIWQTMATQDIRWAEEHVVAGKKFCNKLWNAARFVMLHVQTRFPQEMKGLKKTNPKLTNADKKILALLEKIIQATTQDLENYRFGYALQRLYRFFWHEFCDVYLETSKKQLLHPLFQKHTQQIMLHVLATSLKLLHPFIPFITEAIYLQLPLHDKKKYLMIETWPAKRSARTANTKRKEKKRIL